MNLSRSLLSLLLLAASTLFAAERPDALFARATQLSGTDLPQARESYRLAALGYLADADTAKERGPLLYNAGNAFFLAGDLGRSVAAYRRAEPEMSGSPLLRANLAFVRKQGGNPDESFPQGWLGFIRITFRFSLINIAFVVC